MQALSGGGAALGKVFEVFDFAIFYENCAKLSSIKTANRKNGKGRQSQRGSLVLLNFIKILLRIKIKMLAIFALKMEQKYSLSL